MGWVNEALKELASGRTVQFRPFGGSMKGRIESGQLVTLAPIASGTVEVDDIVLVRWKGNYLLHLVKEIRGDLFLIGNNLGKSNGWATSDALCGKVIAVADQTAGPSAEPTSARREPPTVASGSHDDSEPGGFVVLERDTARGRSE